MPGGITPNGSVRWFVESESTRASVKDSDQGNGKHRLEGNGSTVKGNYFEIIIRYPSGADNRAQVIAQLMTQLSAATSSGADNLTLYLPIEDKTSGYDPGQGKNPLRSDDLNANLGPTDWQIYFDWSKTKADLPPAFRNGWKYRDGTPID